MYTGTMCLNSVIVKMALWETFFVVMVHNSGTCFLNKKSLWVLIISWKFTRLLATYFHTVKEDELVWNNHPVSSVSCQYVGYIADPWVWKSTEWKICYISLCLEIVLVSSFSGLHQHCNENKPKSKEATNATLCLLCWWNFWLQNEWS